jgi:hypothetical protein
MHHDYTGQGVDQLKDIITKIMTTPEDRRLIMTGAWVRFSAPSDSKCYKCIRMVSGPSLCHRVTMRLSPLLLSLLPLYPSMESQ